MRVATASIHRNTLEQMQKSNADLAKTSFQVTSGLKAERFEDIAAQAGQLLNLQDLRGINEQFIKNMETVDSRLQSSENSIQGMVDLVVEAANLWTLGRNENTAEVRANLAPKAEGLTETFYSLFKTKFDGRYIFSGASGDRPPITSSPVATTVPAGIPAPNTYYNGDSQELLVITSTDVTQTYGITGGEDGFANMKAGLEALWFGLENNSESDIDGAINLLNQAQVDLSNMLGEIGGQQSGFDLLKTRHVNTNLFLTEQVDNIEKVDIAEAMTRFTQQQTTLEASMAVITQLNRLSLLDYI
ncbi:MAG: flagellar hook-associated protein 3 FlgL [Alphaproteobacteria bacterium]|jgi:flagellar hook-associated protein 3 FlgL